MKEKEKTIHDVPVPVGISEQMVEVAKYYVSSRLQEGFTVQGMCREMKMSSATWSSWKENKVYMDYINAMNDVLIPQDELQAVREVKKKLLQLAYKDGISKEEIKLFLSTFEYAVEADNRLRAEKLGLTKGNTSQSNGMSVEERKVFLLARLTNKQ